MPTIKIAEGLNILNYCNLRLAVAMRLHNVAFFGPLAIEKGNCSKTSFRGLQTLLPFEINGDVLDACRSICHELLNELDLPLSHRVLCNPTPAGDRDDDSIRASYLREALDSLEEMEKLELSRSHIRHTFRLFDSRLEKMKLVAVLPLPVPVSWLTAALE